MKRLLRALKRVFGKRGKLGDVWRWAKKGKPMRRWHAAFNWARKKERWMRAHRRFDRAKWWAQKKTIYRHKWKRAVRHHKQTGQAPAFQPWMLNGHSGNIDEDLKPVVAWLVVVQHQAVTDTYDYCCHAAGSYHYPRNNSDGQGHAVDTAGPNMCPVMAAELQHFGSQWLELFGPCDWYIKNGVREPGMFPGHSTHIHSAVA